MSRADLAALVCATAAVLMFAALVVLAAVWRRNVHRLRAQLRAARKQNAQLSRRATKVAEVAPAGLARRLDFALWTAEVDPSVCVLADELKGNDS